MGHELNGDVTPQPDVTTSAGGVILEETAPHGRATELERTVGGEQETKLEMKSQTKVRGIDILHVIRN